MDSFLIIFLLLNAVILGIAGTLAVQYGLAHFRPKEKKVAPQDQPMPKMLPEMKKQLLAEAENKFRAQIDKSTVDLDKDIQKTATELSTHVTKIGGQIIDTEMQRYRESLDALRRQTEQIVKQAQTGVTDHQNELNNRYAEAQNELHEKLKADVAAEKEKLLAQIDSKLSDAVVSFLMETLQHNVDLGAQTNYIISVLEEHREEIVKEIGS